MNELVLEVRAASENLVRQLDADLKTSQAAQAKMASEMTLMRSELSAVKQLGVDLKMTQAAQEKMTSDMALLRSELSVGIDHISAGMKRASSVAEKSAEASANAFSQTTAAIRSAAERQASALQHVVDLVKKLGESEVAELRREVATIRTHQSTQQELLVALSKKKGFTF